MGTQQILLIVLSVIIVGAAVAVGIQMFNSQAESSNRSACLMDMNTYASMAIAWYKTPMSLGGRNTASTTTTADQLDELGAYVDSKYDAATTSISNDNGKFDLSIVGETLTIEATGNETGVDPKIDVVLNTGKITTTVDPE